MCGIAAAMGAQAAGGALRAYNEVQAGKQERNYYNMLADNDEAQAKIVKIQGDKEAANIQDRAALDNENLKGQVRRVEGSQKVAVAASGMGAGSVSAEDLARDTMSKAAKDEALIRYNADLGTDEVNRSTNFNVSQLNQSAKMKRYSGKMAVKAAKMNAAATILGSSGQVASSWYSYKKA